VQQRTAIVDELARLPAQPFAAMQVLRLVEDARASSADLARVIETDPALSARVMRLANAPYYGLSGKVGSASRAVVLLGFSAVRALAVSASSGLLADEVELGPTGFWSHSVVTAVASSVVARHLGTPVSDAFSAGLLHDLGLAIPNLAELATLDDVGHAEIGARALEAWRFPRAFVRAVECHHMPPDRVAESLGRIVIAGEALGLKLQESPFPEAGTKPEHALDALAIPKSRIPQLMAEIERGVDRLARFLGTAA
jgi:putative nucleotidyltransferase with HDIG domain